MDEHTLALARFMVRDMDTAASEAERIRTMPTMAAELAGQARAYRKALAYLTGLNGSGTVDDFIAMIRRSDRCESPVCHLDHDADNHHVLAGQVAQS